MRAGQVWRGRRFALAHEGPRNESNNNAHEPTSVRSTRYGSGHLIRVFRDIGHIFSSLYPSSSVLKGGVKVCQQQLVNELLGPLVTKFVRNFGREGATPIQRGWNGSLLGRI